MFPAEDVRLLVPVPRFVLVVKLEVLRYDQTLSWGLIGGTNPVCTIVYLGWKRSYVSPNMIKTVHRLDC